MMKSIFKIKFGTQCMLALALGVLFGIVSSSQLLEYFAPIGDLYLKLLKLTIVPLTFSTIVASFAQYENFALMKRLILNTLMWFLITAIFASSIGIAVASLTNVGSTLSVTLGNNQQLNSMPSILSTFMDMVPTNIIGQIAAGKVIPVIIFAIFFGLALSATGSKGKLVGQFFSEFSQVMFKITRAIIKLSPIGIFVLMAQVSNKYGLSSLLPLIEFILVMYLACLLQLVVYFILIMLVAKMSPLTFLRGFFPAMATAFSTSSSMGTLPVTMERLVDYLKIREDIVGFVAPLGANMKMDACGAIFPAVVSILTAHLFHIDLGLQQYVLIFMLSTVAAFCTVGMPGTALMSATFVLIGLGLPLQGLAIVLGIDRIIDMMRTLTNVTGTATCAILVNKTVTHPPVVNN
jgi:Na+/H+-dicarboxylate symporter